MGRSLNMRPALSAFDHAHKWGRDPIGSGNVFLHAIIGTYCKHLLVRQFCTAGILAYVGRAMHDLVRMIILRRVPSKIVQSVVTCVAVVVAAFVSLRSRPNKSRQNEAMHLEVVPSPIFEKIDLQTGTAMSVLPRTQRTDFPSRSLPSSYPTEIAEVRNFVDSFKAFDWQPLLFHGAKFSRELG